MKGYTWYVISTEEDGKNYAHAWRIKNNTSIISDPAVKRAKTVNACSTKKEACMIAQAWNDSYKANGTYMF